jgi:hypothetical protein
MGILALPRAAGKVIQGGRRGPTLVIRRGAAGWRLVMVESQRHDVSQVGAGRTGRGGDGKISVTFKRP